MSIRLVSSAKNLREQFKAPISNESNPTSPSGTSVYTSSSGVSRSKTLEPPAGATLSRQNSLLRSSSGGNLRRAKSAQKKGLMSKVFADEEADPHEALPDLSMEVTLLIVKRCVKEIRERGLTTKGILRQVQMAQNQKVIIDTIRMILDDDATTELSPLHRIDIHLVAHAMKWAIRYSEEILVTYEDYQALYVDQDRNFPRFARDLPPTNRAILLDLFSLCADVTLLAHLNNMTLVSVAKAISLSIMAGPEREFSTFDASLQQRNLWGAACEDLLRAFLRIKTTYDLAKIDQEDDVDENRYICNETRVLKSARQQSNEIGRIPSSINLPPRLDISVPSSASSSLPGSTGWPTPAGPMSACTPHSYASNTGYFDMVTPRSASPLSHSGAMYGASLSRSQSLAKSTAPASRPLSPSPNNAEDITEYEELMQDQSHLRRLRAERNSLLRPAESIRRRSSVADMESLYMLPMEASAPADGYESDPEVSHAHEDEDSHESLIPDFADGLGWDFSKPVDMHSAELPSLANFQSGPGMANKYGVNRSNSASSNGSGLGPGGPSYTASPRSIRDLSKQQLTSMRLRQLQEQHQADYPSLQRALAQQDMPSRDQSSLSSPPQGSLNRMTSPSWARVSHGIHHHPAKTSPSFAPRRSRRNSVMRQSISLDPVIMHGRIHKKPDELHADLLARELALQTEKDLVAEDIRFQLLQVKNGDHQEPARASSEFSLQLSPQDLERPTGSSRRSSVLSRSDRPKSMLELSMNNLPEPLQLTASAKKPKSRTFEVVSRPKDIEVSVIFTPILTMGPISPRAELKSKFHESFPERPISPPAGYGNTSSIGPPKRSLTGTSTKSGQSVKFPTSPTSATAHRQQQGLRTSQSNDNNSKVRPSLQQSRSFSGVSTTSSQPSNVDGKSKTSGFMRALSSKLRSKQSDDQLRPATRINNEAIGLPAVSPIFAFEPPRLELSFMDDGLGPTELGLEADRETHLPPASAPALMFNADSEAGPMGSWRRDAQASLPIPSVNTGSGISGSGQQQDLRPSGFTGARRASASMFGSGSSSVREQRLQPRRAILTSPLDTSAISQKIDSMPQEPGRQQQQVPAAIQVSLVDAEHLSSPRESVDSISNCNSISIPKTGAVEKEVFRFSTATLLKDGKLYYQLQWDQFSEIGFKSDIFAEPEQYASGVHPIRLSQEDPRKQSMGETIRPSASSAMMATQHQQQHQQHGMHMRKSTANSRSPSLDLPGQLGQAARTRTSTTQEPQGQGPTPEQRAAAMKVARESFLALANDPKALAELKAGQASGRGRPMIISSGSFAKGSTLPQLDNLPRPPVITSKSIPGQKQSYPSPDPNPSASLKSAQSLEMISSAAAADGKGRGNAQRSMSDKSSPISSATTVARSSSSKTTMQPGSAAVGGGGPGSSASFSSGVPRPDNRSEDAKATKGKKGGGLFGKRSKVTGPKSTTSLASTLPSSSNGGRRRRLFPVGVKRQDVMTRTVESMDEVFPWMCIEHMAGQESGWVMLEPVQEGAVGWVMIDKLDDNEIPQGQQQEDNSREQQLQQHQEQEQHQQPSQSRTAMQAQAQIA